MKLIGHCFYLVYVLAVDVAAAAAAAVYFDGVFVAHGGGFSAVAAVADTDYLGRLAHPLGRDRLFVGSVAP